MLMNVNVQTNGNILLLQGIRSNDCHFFNMKTGLLVGIQKLSKLLGDMKKPSIYLFNHNNGDFYGIQVSEGGDSS